MGKMRPATSTTRIGAALALCLAVVLVAGPADAAKKKKGGGGVFQQSQAVNLAIPDDVAVGASTPLTRTITVPKSFKGRVVGDVNVTGLQTTGNVAGAANDLVVLLSAPNGTTQQLFQNHGDQSLGPWTIDDDTRTTFCTLTVPPCRDPDATLNGPFAGTSNGIFLENGDTGPLSAFNGAGMSGAWTLRIFDDSNIGQTSTFNAWGLKITAANPIPATTGKKKKGGGTFAQTLNPNAPVPDGLAAGASTPVRSTITVGKAFRGKVVGDLDVTGLKTTGSAAGAASNLTFKLTSPTGRTMLLFRANGDTSIGPWTLDDESRASICDAATPPCPDPAQSLNRPFAGSSNVIGAGVAGSGPLSVFDGVPIRGFWTLTVFDNAATATSTLNSWGLKITAAKSPKVTNASGGKAAVAKKKKAPTTFQEQKAFSIPIPQDAAAGASTAISTTITVGKAFKGQSVGDLNVTGLQTTGNAASAANDLNVSLTAPNGNTARLFQDLGDQSIGPFTIDDDTLASVCEAVTPPCSDPQQTLNRPYAGTANTLFLETGGTGPLSAFDGAPMRGTWTLAVVDEAGAATSSIFNGWGLKITPAKPVTG